MQVAIATKVCNLNPKAIRRDERVHDHLGKRLYMCEASWAIGSNLLRCGNTASMQQPESFGVSLYQFSGPPMPLATENDFTSLHEASAWSRSLARPRIPKGAASRYDARLGNLPGCCWRAIEQLQQFPVTS